MVLNNFQKWFLINFIGYTLLFLSLFAGGVVLYFRLVADELIGMGGLLSATLLEKIQKHMILGMGIMAVLVVSLVGLAAYQALFFSRRIAGPIFALSRHLDQCLKNQELKPVKLREGDLFIEVAEKFNRIVDQVNDHSAKRK